MTADDRPPRSDAGDFVKSLAEATVAASTLLRRAEGIPGEENRVDILRRLEVTLLRAGMATMGLSPEIPPIPVVATTPGSSPGFFPVDEFDALLKNLESLRQSVLTSLIEDENSGFENATPKDPLIRAALRELNSGLEEILGEAGAAQ